MKSLAEKTSETKKEHAFLVLGWMQDGNFLFNGIAGDDDKVEYCHIVLPENGDVNCMTFDKEAKKFKKVVDVISVGQNGGDMVPACTFESPKSLSVASFAKEKDESNDDKLYDDCIESILRQYDIGRSFLI